MRLKLETAALSFAAISAIAGQLDKPAMSLAATQLSASGVNAGSVPSQASYSATLNMVENALMQTSAAYKQAQMFVAAIYKLMNAIQDLPPIEYSGTFSYSGGLNGGSIDGSSPGYAGYSWSGYELPLNNEGGYVGAYSGYFSAAFGGQTCGGGDSYYSFC